MNSKYLIIGVIAFLFFGFSVWAISASKKNRPQEVVSFSSAGQKVGTDSAKITLIEFADFQCPACRSYEPALKQVKEAYKENLLFIFKHFPLKAIHKNAMPAAVAAEAAGRQEKFWEYHDILYSNQEEWANLPNPSEKFEEYASALELDLEKFKNDIKDKSIESAVNAQIDEGINAGVNATPTFYLNGEYLRVSASFDSFKNAIDKALSK